jgi:tetratricopeptide (TPR) repeat protein
MSTTTSGSSNVDSVVSRGVALQRAGQLEAAEVLYREALASEPGHPVANHNLGTVLMMKGEVAAGLAHLQSAFESEPSRELYRRSYARALLYRADALAECGRLEEAVTAYREALAREPELAEAHYHLGSVLSETGQISAGFAHLMRRAVIVRGGDDAAVGALGPPHKAKHDREQRDYLIARGVIARTDPEPIFHLGNGERLSTPAVNGANATQLLVREWRTCWPQRIVVDGFLTRAALERLRDYCADSTIWRRVYDAGYIGATLRDGFASPLLAQIAEETRDVYADILRAHPFRYMGAFKYDSELSTGTNIHADVSAINVNLYITPDSANLDPETGGMLIWDVEARSEAEMRLFNGDESALRAHLTRTGAKRIRIPYRANRAILFKSSLFHRTDECHFREGYLNKRINVSLLYGDWGAPTGSSSNGASLS